jgi:hypothetical protein
MTVTGIHLVGSTPFANAGEAFSVIGPALGPWLQRIPDGETGYRRGWSVWLDKVFADDPQFEKTGRIHQISEKPGDPGVAKYQLRDGVRPEEVRFHLPHAKFAIADYEDFKRAKAKGELPPDCRFQFAFAPAHVVIWRWFVEELHETLEPLYDQALIAEIGKMLDVIPATELAIQWDIASRVFARLEWGAPTRYGNTKTEMIETFTRNLVTLGIGVPDGVELLYHFCYGYTGQKHTVEPSDMADMVAMANRVTQAVARPIQLIHMPVPQGRRDDSYFAPLAQLRLRPETEISLGLVHAPDSTDGGRARMQAASKYLDNYSISTECGWGQHPKDKIRELIALHASLAR